MKQSNDHRIAWSRVLAAILGIVITCVATFVIFMTWFYIREEVLGNRDDLVAMAIQMLVCAGLLFVGCGTSIAYAVVDDSARTVQPSVKRDKLSAVPEKTQSE